MNICLYKFKHLMKEGPAARTQSVRLTTGEGVASRPNEKGSPQGRDRGAHRRDANGPPQGRERARGRLGVQRKHAPIPLN